MRYVNSIHNVILAVVLSLVSSNAFSQVDVIFDVKANIYSNRVEAECYIELGQEEPYSAMHGDCRLLQNGESFALTLVRSYPIPYPRPSDWSQYFYAIGPEVTPSPNYQYCAKFGWPVAGLEAPYVITLGHFQNSDLNVEFPELSNCAQLPPPLTTPVGVAGYILDICYGGALETKHHVSWIDTSPGTTAKFKLYRQQPTSSSLPYLYFGTVYSSYATVLVNGADSNIKVNACDSGGSCTPLSSETYLAQYIECH